MSFACSRIFALCRDGVLVAVVLAVAPADAARANDLALLPSVLGATERQASDGRSGLGLSGYDPVSYRLEGEPRPGRARHEAVWGGLAWRFASAANRAAFLRDPAAFLPRVGGYDAVAASSGLAVSADPLVFAVRDDGLYLFRSAESRTRFLADQGAVRAAESGWQQVRAGLVGG